MVEAAQQFAESSPWPDPATATTHVYAEPSRRVPEPPAAPPAETREITFMQATLEALAEEMAAQPDDLRAGRRHRQARRQLQDDGRAVTTCYGPERLCDTPICERGFVGLGVRRGDDRHAAGHRLHVRRLRPRRASARSSTRSPRCST